MYQLFLDEVGEALALGLQHVPNAPPLSLAPGRCAGQALFLEAFSFHRDETCCMSLMLPTLPSGAQAVAMKGKGVTRAQRDVIEEKERERPGGK